MKKTLLISLLFALALTATPAVTHAQSDAILLVTPARYSVMQVAFDVARRYPRSRQLSGQSSRTHAPRLERLRMDAPEQRRLSQRRIPANQPRPRFSWAITPYCRRPCKTFSRGARRASVGRIETHDLVNGIGTYLPFTPADWRWFAGRYNLTLSNLKAAEAEAAREQSWYKESGPVKDAPPSFFRYFTRSRKGRAVDTTPAIEPVQVPSSEPDVSSAP